VFTYTRGENAQWTASSTTGDFTKSAKVLPDVIVAAYDDKIRTLQEKLTALNEELPQLEERAAQMDAAIEADLAALEQARAQREQFLAQLREDYSTLSQQVVQKTEEGQQVEQVVEARRTDVFRLENQLQLLQADDARIEQIEQQMLDLIRQIDADLAKAQRRQNQLEERLGEDTAATSATRTQPGR
jgi:chromosome segregation ATPase